jgi:PKD repeat protein
MTSGSTILDRGHRPGTRIRRTGLTALLSIGLLAASLPVAAPALAATYSFTSIADSYTSSASPSGNYGTQTSVRVRASSTINRAYLRFTVAGLDGAVQSAKLRLFVTDGSPQGGTVRRTTGGWTETGLTWNNAPALDSAVLATAGKVAAGTWIELDVTAAVTGNGDVNLGIQTTSSNSTLYASRESANDPTLVVTTASAPPPAPVANFSGTPLSGTAPLQVAFSDLSTNTPTSWAWDFQNDGTIDSTSKNPTFTYQTAGTYDVSLTVGNAGGSNTKTVTGYVVVSAATAPTAAFTGSPTDGIAPLQVSFTDQSTNNPTTWAWDFQNDGVTDSTVRNPTFTYTTPGSYDVRLTVTNAGGSDSQVIQEFVVVGAPPPAPVADFSATPTSGTAPLAVSFTDASTNAPTSWAWDFQNDGVTDSTAQNPSFTYVAAGTYTVRLTSTNLGGSDGETKTGMIVVGGSGGGSLTFVPIADSQVKSTSPSGNYGTAVTLRLRNTSEIYRSYLKFTVSGLTVAPTSARIRLFVEDSSPDGGRIYPVSNTWTETGITWDNAPLISGTGLSSVGPVTTGTWVEFDVSAAVTDNGTYSFGILNNSSDSALYSSREGTNSPELIVSSAGQGTSPPVASFSGVPTSGSAPLTVQFTDLSSNGPNAWAWDFQNDGVTDSTVRNPSFTYTSNGTYSVKLTASNAGGSNALVRTAYVTVAAGPAPGPADVTFVGAGDIASCSSTGDEATATLVDAISGTVYTLGDNVYETGTPSEFANCYDPSWGRFKARTRPTVGNHDYGTANASGYYGYFGAAAGDPTKGYYSYELGQWHIVVLNSNCSEVGGCGVGSAQETWLRQDLAANTASCTLGMWHEPRFSSGSGGGATFMVPLLQALYDDNAEIVLSGHMHFYERFAPQTPAGVADPARGIRQFTVGTGGKSLAGFATIAANSEVRNNQTYGVLRLTLHADGYTWQFVPIAGKTFTDTGSQFCH